jgi:RNA polymerase subunit RPABC4/transcription elongation factor Spt4
VQICSKCNTQNSDQAIYCQNCHADLRKWSTTAVALKKLQDNPRVSYIRVIVSKDSCPACQAVEGSYEKFSVPKLPVEGCSNSLGCRCFYEPVLEVVYP